MRVNHLTAGTLLPALTLAHFSLLEPSTVHTIPGTPATVSPCGYVGFTDSSDTANTTGITGNPATYLGLLALTTHGSATWNFKFFWDVEGTGVPSEGTQGPMPVPDFDVFRTVKTQGDGNFCVTNAWVADEVREGWGDAEGKFNLNGWISVSGEMDDGTFYQCAHVKYSYAIPAIWPTICANSTGVTVEYADGNGHGNTTTTTSATTLTTTSDTTVTTPGPGTNATTHTSASTSGAPTSAPWTNTTMTTATPGPSGTTQPGPPTGAASGFQASLSGVWVALGAGMLVNGLRLLL